jgi:uncharacterized membrane protein
VVTRWLRLVAVAIALTAVSSAPTPAHAQTKSFTLDSWIVTARINTDASMDVTELLTYDFVGGPFNFGIRTFDTREEDISGFAASDPEGPLEVIPPARSVSGEWEWALRRPTSDATVTYTLTYHVADAVEVGSDVADLNWMFIGEDHPSIGDVAITVDFPPGIPAATADVADSDTTVLRAFAHGPSNGVIRVAQSRATATVTGVGNGQFVEIRAIAPATAFDARGSETLLAKILKQERQLQDEKKHHELAWVLTPILAAVGALGTGLLWLVGGRERKSTEVLGEYWREPLDERPAVALANLNRGTVNAGPTIAGTIVDLAQRGYIRIIGEHIERFGPDKTIHRYQWAGKEFAPDVVQYERDVLEMLFRGQTETTSEDVNDWARHHQSSAQSKLNRIKAGVKAEYIKYGFETKVNPLHMGLLVALCAAVGLASFLVKVWTKNGFAWLGVGAAAALLAGGSYILRNRSQAGADAAAKARGLRNYLRDFSRLDEAPVGHLILWERYLVYAVALGVSKELIHGLETRVPQVANDPAFGLWYVGMAGHRFDAFDQIEVQSSSFVSAATPNRSGSGGGFSGGSSGGGGGGGAGAR